MYFPLRIRMHYGHPDFMDKGIIKQAGWLDYVTYHKRSRLQYLWLVVAGSLRLQSQQT
jgi:hypothetical protein